MSCKTLSTYYPFPASELIKDRCVKKEILKLIKSQGSGTGAVNSVNGQTGTVVLNAGDVGALESIVAGSNITIDNTDPQNPVISASGGGGGSYTFSNGLTETGGEVKLGGVISENTDINMPDGIEFKLHGTQSGISNVPYIHMDNNSGLSTKLSLGIYATTFGTIGSIRNGIVVDVTRVAVKSVVPAIYSDVLVANSFTDNNEIPNVGYVNSKVAERVQTLVAGTNITIDDTDPENPIINATGGSGGGQVDSVVAGTGIDIDASDPQNPEVSLDSTTQASLALADTSLQPGDNISELTNDSAFIDTTAGDARYLKLGGNAIGTALSFGTNDNQQIDVRLNNDTRLRFHNWFSQYGVMHPTQNSGIVFGNNQVKYPSTGTHIWYANGSSSANAMRYDNSGLAIGYADNVPPADKLQVNGHAAINGTVGAKGLNIAGASLIKGESSTTGYGLRVENSAGNVGLQVDNNLSVGIGKAPADGFILDMSGSRAAGANVRIQNTNTSGLSGFSFTNNGGSTVGYLGYGNSGSGVFPSQMVFNSTSPIPLSLAYGGVTKIQLTTVGDVRLPGLAGTGTRMVVADEDGDLSTQSISFVPEGELIKITDPSSYQVTDEHTLIVVTLTTDGSLILPSNPAIKSRAIIKVLGTTNTLTVTPSGSGNIDGEADLEMMPKDSCMLLHLGSDEWIVIGT